MLAVAGYGLAALTGGRHVRDQGGTMFGVFHRVTGLATLLVSLIAGALWQQIGPTGTFGAGALLAALGIPAVIVVSPRGP